MLSTQWGKKEEREPSSEMRASSKIGNTCWRREEANSNVLGWCESAFIACVSRFTSTAPASLDVNPSNCTMQEPAGLQSSPAPVLKHSQAAAPANSAPHDAGICSWSQSLQKQLWPIPVNTSTEPLPAVSACKASLRLKQCSVAKFLCATVWIYWDIVSPAHEGPAMVVH